MKVITAALVARALADINRKENEAKLPEQFKAAQDAFKNNTNLANREDLADLHGLITGFRPRTTNQRIVPFEVFEVVSPAEQRVIKTAICMASANGVAYGCASMAEGAIRYDEKTCQFASPENAEAFIKHEVNSWDDTTVLKWVNSALGADALPKFLTEIERTSAAQLAAMASKSK